MENNIADEKINKVAENKVVAEPDCNAEKTKAYNASRLAGFSHDFATGHSYSVFFMCMSFRIEQLSTTVKK